jgi:hypothetical protein
MLAFHHLAFHSSVLSSFLLSSPSYFLIPHRVLRAHADAWLVIPHLTANAHRERGSPLARSCHSLSSSPWSRPYCEKPHSHLMTLLHAARNKMRRPDRSNFSGDGLLFYSPHVTAGQRVHNDLICLVDVPRYGMDPTMPTAPWTTCCLSWWMTRCMHPQLCHFIFCFEQACERTASVFTIQPRCRMQLVRRWPYHMKPQPLFHRVIAKCCGITLHTISSTAIIYMDPLQLRRVLIGRLISWSRFQTCGVHTITTSYLIYSPRTLQRVGQKLFIHIITDQNVVSLNQSCSVWWAFVQNI